MMITTTRRDPRAGATAVETAPSHRSPRLAGPAHDTKAPNGHDHVDHRGRARSRTITIDVPEPDLLHALKEELDR